MGAVTSSPSQTMARSATSVMITVESYRSWTSTAAAPVRRSTATRAPRTTRLYLFKETWAALVVAW